MSELPEPLTPADCDLRGLPFMPMDTIRIIDSDLFALSTGEEFKAAFALWCKSWQQIPAASLPDDDRVLAHLSGTGARWKKVKATALRNWIKCSDGRLYHPVVAEKAIEALPMRQEYRERKSGEADRKAREREDRKAMFAQLRAVGVTPEYNIRTSDLRALVTKHVTQEVTPPVTPVTVDVTAKTGTGTGTGTEDNNSEPNGSVVALAPEPENDLGADQEIDEALADWNRAASETGWPKATKLTQPRRASLRARLKEHDLDGWRSGIDRARRSPVLAANPPPAWFTFDWITKPANFLKLIEGNYDRSFSASAHQSSPGSNGGGRTVAALNRVFGGMAGG